MAEIEWRRKEEFRGRSVTITLGERVVATVPVPDELVLCDLCNAEVDLDPVPILEGYALCSRCLRDIDQG